MLGQWLMISCQWYAEAGSVSWESVAVAPKSILSPTFQVRLGDGAVIVALGGVLPEWIATESVSEAPCGSVTLTVAV